MSASGDIVSIGLELPEKEAIALARNPLAGKAGLE